MTAATGRCVRVACDESGFSGGNLVDARTPVFAHASVQIDTDDAASLMSDLRTVTSAPDREFKASRLLRPAHRPALLEFLGPAGRLSPACWVQLSETRFFVLARLVDVLLGTEPVNGVDRPGAERATRQAAVTLHRLGPRCVGDRGWREFLTLASTMLRTNNRWLSRTPIPAFYSALDQLIAEVSNADLRDVLRRLAGTESIAERTRGVLEANLKSTPLMEPLLPAFHRAVDHWADAAADLAVVHDEQSGLTPERIADVAARVMAGHPALERVDVTLADSRADPRVQVADIVAGTARRVASDELAGRADPELVELVHPMIDPESLWSAADSGLVPAPW